MYIYRSISINVQGMVQIGNAWIDDNTSEQGMYDYFWTHALNSDETHAGIQKYCDFVTGNLSNTCYQYLNQGDAELGDIDIYNIYAPSCNLSAPKSIISGSVSICWISPSNLFSKLKLISFLKTVEKQRTNNIIFIFNIWERYY